MSYARLYLAANGLPGPDAKRSRSSVDTPRARRPKPVPVSPGGSTAATIALVVVGLALTAIAILDGGKLAVLLVGLLALVAAGLDRFGGRRRPGSVTDSRRPAR
jgi:hypothetical protein